MSAGAECWGAIFARVFAIRAGNFEEIFTNNAVQIIRDAFPSNNSNCMYTRNRNGWRLESRLHCRSFCNINRQNDIKYNISIILSLYLQKHPQKILKYQMQSSIDNRAEWMHAYCSLLQIKRIYLRFK